MATAWLTAGCLVVIAIEGPVCLRQTVGEFEQLRIDTGEAVISMSRGGAGPGVLLLHGFPQTRLMWRDIAPLLADRFTVICADLRGYGDSSTPPSSEDHTQYSKRAMARDMVAVMSNLGFEHFSIAGHDRGGRVAYRTALDHPDQVDALAVLDVLPIDSVWDRADDRLTLGFWPWSLLAQSEPLPESAGRVHGGAQRPRPHSRGMRGIPRRCRCRP